MLHKLTLIMTGDGLTPWHLLVKRFGLVRLRRNLRTGLVSNRRRCVKSQLLSTLFKIIQLSEGVVSGAFKTRRRWCFLYQIEYSLNSVLLLVHRAKQITSIQGVCDFTEVDLANGHVGVLQVGEQFVDHQVTGADVE